MAQKTKRVIFFRHGETDWNKADLVQGHTDNTLNENGIRQAEILRDKLRREGIQHILSSDLKRALQTAFIVAKGCSATISLHPEIREVNFGAAEGKPRSQMRTEYPRLYELLSHPELSDSHEMAFPGGETRMQVFKRASEKLYDFLSNEDLDVVGVSTHGGVIGSILAVSFQKWEFIEPCQDIEISFCNNRKCFVNYLPVPRPPKLDN